MKAVLDDDSEGIAEERAAIEECNKAVRDGDTVKLSRYFADVLDTIHTRPSSSAWSEDSPTTSDREKLEREDAQFRAALAVKVTENLRTHGIRVVKVIDNGERDGYRVFARDRAGRGFEIEFKFSLIDEIIATGGQVDCVRRLFERVTSAILAERERYFARMS